MRSKRRTCTFCDQEAFETIPVADLDAARTYDLPVCREHWSDYLDVVA